MGPSDGSEGRMDCRKSQAYPKKDAVLILFTYSVNATAAATIIIIGRKLLLLLLRRRRRRRRAAVAFLHPFFFQKPPSEGLIL
jgi:hypothetical protein